MSARDDGPRAKRVHSTVYYATVAFFLAVAVGFVAFGVFVGQRSIARKQNPITTLGQIFIPPPQNYFGKDRINVLLLGIDYNYDQNDQEYSAGARSDTIMALSLDFPTEANPNPSIHILSIPRDTLYTFPDGHQDKINTAYQQGGSSLVKSSQASERAVADFLGLPGGFDRYVTLRIDATKEVIDAIGGIDVVPDETMDYDDTWGHLHIHFIGGKLYHMNGDQAVSYSRFRHDACSDPCRIKRQQQVIRIAINKLKNEKFNDLMHINQLIGVFNRNVVTDFTPAEEVSIANAFSTIDLSAVKTDQVPYLRDEELDCCGDVLIADDDAKAQLVQKYFLDPVTPVATSPPVDPKVLAAIPPSTIQVDVQNGTGEPGIAGKLASELQAQGFKIASVADADSFDHDTTEIHVHSTKQPLAGERVRSALALQTAEVSIDTPTPSATPSSDVTVIVGRDYDAAPQKQASAEK
ncbi:MAG TPA: LCP family protein [Candidatus Acidoferrales bacterium]|nr:LCP family protein [Candidatus Acidoferrales bacterium]